ncbi:MAG: polyketide synthase, partial [Rhodospirillaceae bacterium]
MADGGAQAGMTKADATAGGEASAVKRALAALREAKAKIAALENAARAPIAVIGMGCRFPGAEDPEAFWQLLAEGRDAVGPLPPGRWDREAWYDPDPEVPGRTYVDRAGWIDLPDGLDATFFGITPKEARTLDPQQRLTLEVAWESLEHAGIRPSSLQGSRAGVYMGVSSDDYMRLAARDPDSIDAYLTTGNVHSVVSGRLSYILGLTGPSVSVDTACSSALVAVAQAISALRAGDCDLA